MASWREVIQEEWQRRSLDRKESSKFSLAAQGFDEREIIAAVDVLLSGRITMGEQVRRFEQRFAERVGANYAVMVNSGSSANLLALAAACNFTRSKRLMPGDEVLVPAVCWSTSVWPIKQLGLTPVFVDVDPVTLNIDLNDMKRRASPRTKAVMAVHVLGNSAPMNELVSLCETNKWMLLEDTCESLGSTATVKNRSSCLGTFGEFGMYSFYYSHHITTGEGGMVVCQTKEDNDLLKCLRAHGWSRELSNRANVEAANPRIDASFLFVNEGYNFRPMEIQAAFGLCQIERLESMNKARIANRANLITALTAHPHWHEQFMFPLPASGTEPAWFGFPCLMNQTIGHHRSEYLKYLSRAGVENRPIISGNFTRQPALQALNIACEATSFVGAELINNQGFFVGLHGELLSQPTIAELAEIMVSYDFRRS